MGEPALREAQPLAPIAQPASEAGSLVSMIERAARDSSVDVDKMVRLFDLHARAVDRAAVVAFNQALADMQPLLPVIAERGRIEVPGKDGKAGHSTPFAKWEDINDAIRPVLHDHGFALSFRPGTAADGKVTVTGVLRHRDGHSDEATVTLMHDSSGSKNAVQAVGSSLSYGKRYAALSLLNITTRGEDDDAEAAGAKDLGDDAQRQVAKINACETSAQLAQWHAQNREAVTRLPKPEAARVIALWRERTAKTSERA